MSFNTEARGPHCSPEQQLQPINPFKKNIQDCIIKIRKIIHFKFSVTQIWENLNVYINWKKTEVNIFTQTEKKTQITSKVNSSQISNLYYVDIAFKPNSL